MSNNEDRDMAGTDKRELRITRREAIWRVSTLLGGAAIVGQGAMLAACSRREPQPEATPPPTTSLLSQDAIALLDEIADTMLPETATPGAKAAGVGPFMAVMVTDAYSPSEQQIFIDGLAKLDSDCLEQHGTGFLGATPEVRLAFLEQLDAEQWKYTRERGADDPVHYFRMMKELALLGYFTSEVGYTQAMRYVETPGSFEPCAPYTPGDKTWATHA